MPIGLLMSGLLSQLWTASFYNVSCFTFSYLAVAHRVLVVKMFGLQLKVEQSGVESTSRGLVGDTSFAVLPNIKPIHTFAITIILQSVSMFFMSNEFFLMSSRSFLLNSGEIQTTNPSSQRLLCAAMFHSSSDGMSTKRPSCSF